MLAAIASQTQPKGPEKGEDQSRPSFWEIPYIEVLQLSITNLKGALNLQCRFAAGPKCHLNHAQFTQYRLRVESLLNLRRLQPRTDPPSASYRLWRRPCFRWWRFCAASWWSF